MALTTFEVVLRYWNVDVDYPGWYDYSETYRVVAEPLAITEFIHYRNEEIRALVKAHLCRLRDDVNENIALDERRFEAIRYISASEAEFLGLDTLENINNRINNRKDYLKRLNADIDLFDSSNITDLYRYHPVVKYRWEYHESGSMLLSEFGKIADEAESDIEYRTRER